MGQCLGRFSCRRKIWRQSTHGSFTHWAKIQTWLGLFTSYELLTSRAVHSTSHWRSTWWLSGKVDWEERAHNSSWRKLFAYIFWHQSSYNETSQVKQSYGIRDGHMNDAVHHSWAQLVHDLYHGLVVVLQGKVSYRDCYFESYWVKDNNNSKSKRKTLPERMQQMFVCSLTARRLE